MTNEKGRPGMDGLNTDMTNEKGRPGMDGLNDDGTGIDFNMAARFLQALDPKGGYCFQTFDDRSPKDEVLTRTLHGSFEQHRAELFRLNRRGAGVFVTVNKTDGKGRKRRNIVSVRAVFLDLDGAPLPESWDLEPHFIVETSPGRWHVYWLVAPDFPLDRFEAVQKAIAARYGGDPSVCDLSRVMRLPGFLHRKKELFRSRVMCDWSIK